MENNFGLIVYALTSKELFRYFLDLFDMIEVMERQREVIKYVKDYYQEMRDVPSIIELQHKFGDLIPNDVYLEADYVKKELKRIIRNETLKSYVIRISEDIESDKVDYDKVYEELRRLRIRLETPNLKIFNVGDMTKEVINQVVEIQKDSVVPTGIDSVDKVLGGIGRGEITILIAPPGTGKTTFLVNCAFGAAILGVNVLYVSLELNEKRIAERVIRRASKLTREEIRAYREKSEKEIERIFRYIQSDIKILYRRPSSLSSMDLEAILDLQSEKTRPELLIVDYLDKMKVFGDFRRALGTLTDELRLLAEQYNLAVVTATQANRGSISASVVTEEHVSESFKKIENADLILSLCMSDKELKEGKARVVILKNREGRGKNLRGTIIPVKCDLQRILIE